MNERYIHSRNLTKIRSNFSEPRRVLSISSLESNTSVQLQKYMVHLTGIVK